MDPLEKGRLLLTRRHFFSRTASGLGVAALASLLNDDLRAATGGLPGLPHFTPKAKRVIYLFMHGGPAQLDLFEDRRQPASERLQQSLDAIRGKFGEAAVRYGRLAS